MEIQAFCPSCGARRLASFRYCRGCGFDYDAPELMERTEPAPLSPPQSGVGQAAPGSWSAGAAAASPLGAALSAPTAARGRSIARLGLVIVAALTLAAVFKAAVLDPPLQRQTDAIATQVARAIATPAGAWDADESVAWFEAQGFSGHDSPLADGTPRWLAKDPSGGIAEVTGSGEAASVSLTVVASREAGVTLALMLARWCPDSSDWFSSQLKAYDGLSEIDAAQPFGGCTVRLQSLTAADGALLATTIRR